MGDAPLSRGDAAPPLPPALAGSRAELSGSCGRVSYYVDGVAGAPPLLLLHSVNAAASAYEVKPLYEHYASTRRVYALDLPGFGFSERSERPYTLRLMTDAVALMLVEIARIEGSPPIDMLALSLGCEFAARAALEQPARLRSLGLVSPTGMNGQRRFVGPPASDRGQRWLFALLAQAPWSAALYRTLTRPAVIRWFLEKTWGGPGIDPGLLDYDILTTRQPGARHAPLAFVSAKLFAADISTVYESLRLPVWVVHGTRGDFVDYRDAARLAALGNWRVDVVPTGALPYFERPAEFIARYDAFLACAAVPSANRPAGEASTGTATIG